MAEVVKIKAPVKYYEIVDKKNSGFIMDGTENMPFQQELTAPSVLWISAVGKMAETDADGVKHFREIRYISGCDSIIPEEQLKMGFTPKKFEDKIPIENGFTSVVREGNTIGLYDYLEKGFYNEDNPDRPQSATPRYREVKLDKKAEVLLDEDEIQTKAKMMVYELRQETGKKDKPYRYDTARIDARCRLLEVWDETPERRLILLLSKAINSPKQFVEIIAKSEQIVITEVSHALELKVVMFDGNLLIFSDSKEVITTVGNKKMSEVDKIEAAAAWLGTGEGAELLTRLRAKLEIAKEKSLQQ